MFKKRNLTYLFILLISFFAMQINAHAQDEYDTLHNAGTQTSVEVDTVASDNNSSNGESYKSRNSKGDFHDIKGNAIYVLPQRKIADSTMNKFLGDEDFWYVNVVEKPQEEKEGFWKWLWRIASLKGTRIAIWTILVLLMLGAIILYLKENQIGLFASASRKMRNDGIDNEAMPDNIFEIDYETAISNALADSNYRLATRFLFLRTLKALSSKNIIDYAADKTNFDYLFQISGTKHYGAFVNAAKHYEYLWYGKFEVNGEQFNLIKNGFDDFQKQIA